MLPISLAVEGLCDEAVLKRLLALYELPAGPVYGKVGKDRLDERLKAYRNAGRFQPWIVLRDLDSDAGCAPELVEQSNVANTKLFRLHVAVRAVEAWLLADRRAFASFLAVPVTRLPAEPESIVDPKQFVVQLARRSRSKLISSTLVPDANSSAKVGRGYTPRLIEFAARQWDPPVAARSSPSLASLLTHLRAWTEDRRS